MPLLPFAFYSYVYQRKLTMFFFFYSDSKAKESGLFSATSRQAMNNLADKYDKEPIPERKTETLTSAEMKERRATSGNETPPPPPPPR